MYTMIKINSKSYSNRKNLNQAKIIFFFSQIMDNEHEVWEL